MPDIFRKKLCFPQGFFFALALAFAPIHAAAPVDSTAVPRLLAEARDKGLAEHPHWLKLLHYRGSGAGRRSDIDGGYFFLADRGATDSRAELEATVRALLSEEDLSPPLDTAWQAGAMHPLCKFPARRRFLQTHLDLPDTLLPAPDCGRWERWRTALRPAGATLIFASSYLNNPASTFGHTYLRLNTHAADSVRAILNYGITYAAAVPPGDGARFVYKGVLGKYPGTYSIVPYFLTLQKYSNLESRDLWEYDLRLDSVQLAYLLEHTWEVGASWMRYWFFDENCSYNIVTLLDAADPDWRLSAGLAPDAVMPSETVKLIREAGLVAERRWRPSLLTAFRIKAAGLAEEERDWLGRVLRLSPEDSLPETALPPEGRARALDAALDYVQYRKRRTAEDKDAPWPGRQRKLLLARAALPPAPGGPLVPDAEVSPPEESHAMRLAGAALGMSGYRPYAEGVLRFIHHDLNARETGFLPGSQIEALKLKVRAYCSRDCGEGLDDVEVRSADILSMQSLPSLGRFRRPPAWAFRLGYDRRPPGSRQAGGSATAEGGAGFALAWPGAVSARGFLLAQAKTRAWRRDGWNASIGPQGRAGLRLAFAEHASLLAETRHYQPWPGTGRREADYGLEVRVSLGRDADLRLGFLAQDDVGEAYLAWNGYF